MAELLGHLGKTIEREGPNRFERVYYCFTPAALREVETVDDINEFFESGVDALWPRRLYINEVVKYSSAYLLQVAQNAKSGLPDLRKAHMRRR